MTETSSLKLDVLRQRRDFLAAAKSGHKGVAPSVIVQMRHQQDRITPRYGITASKKVGNAVIRNRAKRRLRALIRGYLPDLAETSTDYVLIARHNTASVGWNTLVADFRKALKRAAPKAKKQTQKNTENKA
jgi:ribonuclease P protein component